MTALYATPNQFFEEFDVAVKFYHHKTLSPYWRIHTAHRILKISHEIIAKKYHELLKTIFEEGVSKHDFRKESSYADQKALLPVIMDAVKIAASMYEEYGEYLEAQCKRWSEKKSAFQIDASQNDLLMNIQHIVQVCHRHPFVFYLGTIKKYRVRTALFTEA